MGPNLKVSSQTRILTNDVLINLILKFIEHLKPRL